MGCVQREVVSDGLGLEVQEAPCFIPERGFGGQHLLHSSEPQEAERTRNKADWPAVGKAYEGGTREAEPRRPQSD